MDKFAKQAGAYLRYSGNCTSGSTLRCHLEMTATERQLAPVKNDIDTAAFAAVFREADERKPSSPEGLHCHCTRWKTLAEREDFCKYMSVMLSMPFKNGFSVRHWENAIDVVIEKSKGVRMIHSMRIISRPC